MRVLYYYSFLFYSKILRDNEPHLLTTLALSFLEALIINGILEAISVHAFCKDLDKLAMFAILLLIIGTNYWILHRTGKAKEIVKLKPQFFNSHRLSIVITLVFAIAAISLMFWGPIYLKGILDQCR